MKHLLRNIAIVILILVCTGAYQPTVVINITDFGAVGDNHIDNSAALKAAVIAAGNGGTILIPQGMFRWTDPTALALTSNNCNITITGVGNGASQLVPMFSNGDAISFSYVSSTGTASCTGSVRNLSFVEQNPVPTNLNLIHITNTTGIILSSLYAIHFEGTEDAMIELSTGPSSGNNWTEVTKMDNIDSDGNTYMLVLDGSGSTGNSLNNNDMHNSHCNLSGNPAAPAGACLYEKNFGNPGILLAGTYQFSANTNAVNQSVIRTNHRADDNLAEARFEILAQSILSTGPNYCFDAPAGTGPWQYNGHINCTGKPGVFVFEKNNNPVLATLANGNRSIFYNPNTSEIIGDMNGVLNAHGFGAIGDGKYSGDGTCAIDGHLPTSTTFTSPTAGINSNMVGDTIFVDSAGPASGKYIGTITSVTGTTATVSPAFSTGIGSTGASYAIGHDDTAGLQAWINELQQYSSSPLRGKEGYLPHGTYFHRGLNLTGFGYATISGAGRGQYGSGSTLLCIAPSANPNGGPSVCHDFTGAISDTIRDMRFKSGITPQSAGGVNVLVARKDNSYFSIFNVFERVTFSAFGAYDVVNYSSEQNDWIDDTFNENLDLAKAFYLSQANVPGFTSQYMGALVATGSASTTINTFSGGATQFSSNGTNAFIIDGNPQELTIDGAYVRLNTPTDNFIDSNGSAVCTDCNFRSIRVEPDTAGTSTTPSNQFIHLVGTGTPGINGGSVIGGGMDWPSNVTAVTKPTIEMVTAASFNIQGFEDAPVFPNPEVKLTSGSSNYYGNINTSFLSVPIDSGSVNTFSGMVRGSSFIGSGTPSVGGGGVLLVGSNSFSGIITGVAATGNTLLTGVTCPHVAVVNLYDNAGGAVSLTSRTATGIQFSATAGHNVDYTASCT